MRYGQFIITLRTGTIGPAHDPYGTTRVTVNAPNGDHATLYTNGLGMCRAEFRSGTDGGRSARAIEWFDAGHDDRRARQCELKANLIARRSIGLRFDEAERVYHGYSE
jgi:hypothetical protein